MTLEYRQLEALEIRAEGDGRTISGRLVPYDKEQRINSSLVEVFRMGAFHKVVRAAHRVKVLVNHDIRQPVGRAIRLWEERDGLYGDLRISKTRSGDEQLELINDGVISELSIGFQPIQNVTRRDGVIERKLAHLAEVSLVTFGAYGDSAAITGVRDQTGTPNLDSLADILGKIKK
jgi:HK97 family phage prohead protease